MEGRKEGKIFVLVCLSRCITAIMYIYIRTHIMQILTYVRRHINYILNYKISNIVYLYLALTFGGRKKRIEIQPVSDLDELNYNYFQFKLN